MVRSRVIAVAAASILLIVAVVPVASGAPARRVWAQAVLDRVSTPVAIAIEEATGMVAGDIWADQAPSGLASSRSATLAAPTVGVQVRLSDDALAVQQAEPHAAIDPTDPAHILAGAQEGRFFDGGAVANGAYVTFDGGATWRASIVPGTDVATGNPAYERSTDPVVAIGPDGTAFFCSLSLNIATPGGAIFVSPSPDGGRTWDEPVAVATSDSAEHLLDKQWLTVDTNVASPRKGRLYVTWSDFVSPPGNPNGLKAIPIYLASSSDGGATWSAGVEISASDRFNQGSQPVVEPDGTLHVIYYSFNRKGLRIVTSRDGGSTWTKPTTITKMTVGGVPGIRTGSNLPSATVDPVTGNIYAVYQDASRDVADVLLVRSTDGGATWSAPLMVNADPPGQAQFTPAVTALAGQVHVTWTDGNDSSGEPDRYVTAYARSIDGGQTFGPSVAVSASFDMRDAVDTARGRFLGDYQAVVAGGSSVHPVWVDALLGQNDVWSTRVTP